MASDSVVEAWGPEAFAKRLRARLKSAQVQLPPELERSDSSELPRGFNVLLLGPTGAGKSSLVYTWWRALAGTQAREDRASFLKNFAHHSLLRRLQLGWTAESEDAGRSDQLSAAPRHGTTALTAFELQAASDACGHIQIHDTKGQQFFTEEEESFANDMLEGKVLPGSTPDAVHWRYWISIGQFGLFVTTNLASAPHALVLVFDSTLKSFQTVLADAKAGEADDNELAACYRKVVSRARAEGQPVFAVLSHVDQLQVRGTPAEGEDVDELEELLIGSRDEVLERFKELLSAALKDEDAAVPVHQIYCVENYRMDRFEQDAEIDFRALEALDAAVGGANTYIAKRAVDVNAGRGLCTVS